MGRKIKGLTHDEKRILLQSMSLRCLGILERLESETYDLNVLDFFDKNYKAIYNLVIALEDDYPRVDMSTNNIDLLYKRVHMRD